MVYCWFRIKAEFNFSNLRINQIPYQFLSNVHDNKSTGDADGDGNAGDDDGDIDIGDNEKEEEKGKFIFEYL